MINELIKLADNLDRIGYHKEADHLGDLIKKATFEIPDLPDWLEDLAKKAVGIWRLPLLIPSIIENWETIKSLYNEGEGSEDVIEFLKQLSDDIDLRPLEENVDPDMDTEEDSAYDMVDT
jgi:hypothetical protein